MSEISQLDPDWVSPPGATIGALISARGLSETSAANLLGLTSQDYQALLIGDIKVDSALAESLSSLLGTSEHFWRVRESKYQESLAAAARKLQREVALPISDMKRFGWIPTHETDERVLAMSAARFMGVRSVSEFDDRFGHLEEALAFRRSATFDTEIGAVAAWYRAAEIKKQSSSLRAWSPELFRDILPLARTYAQIKDPRDFLPKIERLFADCGVAFSVMQTPTGCPVSGIASVARGRAMIALSSRHLTDDHFWFSLFHEAAHLILHGEKISLEVDGGVDRADEDQANDFAADILVPKSKIDELKSMQLSKFSIARFARSIGLPPGIVVGQLQHMGRVKFGRMNFMKCRYRWKGSTLGMA